MMISACLILIRSKTNLPLGSCGTPFLIVRLLKSRVTVSGSFLPVPVNSAMSILPRLPESKSRAAARQKYCSYTLLADVSALVSVNGLAVCVWYISREGRRKDAKA